MNQLELIRGARIVKQLDEATFADLERNTLQFTPPSDKRQHDTNAVQVTSMELVPYQSELGVNAIVNSRGKQHNPQLLFLNVEYQDDDLPQNVTFTGADGKEYHINQINLSQHNVKVRCTCLDFRWRFSVQNNKADALYGTGPDLYQKKTDRPPNNPRQVPGVCKHLLKLVTELKQNGLVR